MTTPASTTTTTKNKGGRPKLPEGKALSKKAFFRLTPADFEALLAHCLEVDLTPSQLVRHYLQRDVIIAGRKA